MKLRRNTTGWVCVSDSRITVERPRPAGPAGVRCRNGWIVRVRLAGRRRPLQSTVRTLAEAAAWARPHWEPHFLQEVKRTLPASEAHLYRLAVDEGELPTFLVMLDAAQEAGAEFRRGRLIAAARAARLLPADLPETDDERREVRESALRQANQVIGIEARRAHEREFDRPRGLAIWPHERLLIYFDNTPFSDPAIRPRMLGLMSELLGTIGVECLAEASHPASGERAGHTVARAYHPVDARTKDAARGLIECAIRETFETLPTPPSGGPW